MYINQSPGPIWADVKSVTKRHCRCERYHEAPVLNSWLIDDSSYTCFPGLGKLQDMPEAKGARLRLQSIPNFTGPILNGIRASAREEDHPHFLAYNIEVMAAPLPQEPWIKPKLPRKLLVCRWHQRAV